MRVIGGKLRGRRLRAVPAKGVRPTSDRVREALFERLGPLDGLRVLDLFAGTGALGIEALSRGAEAAVFVERAQASVAVIRANLHDLQLEESAKVLRADASAAIRRMGKEGRFFDLIFLDPPYTSGQAESTLIALVKHNVIAEGAEVVLERSKHEPPATVEGLSLVDERVYGDTIITRWTAAVGAEHDKGDQSG